jgi:hypothetical protein
MGNSRSEAGATGADGRRLTVPQAADALGVTVDAVRGRIRRGTLESEHDEAGTVYVWVDVPEEADSRGPSSPGRGPSADQSERIEDLREQVAYLREQLEQERRANSEHRRLLAAALERIPPAIEPPAEAPPDERESPETAEPGQEGESPRSDAPGPQERVQRRPWWRRVFGG